MKILTKKEMRELAEVYNGIKHDAEKFAANGDAEGKRNADVKMAGFMSACSVLGITFKPCANKPEFCYAETVTTEAAILHDVTTSALMRGYLQLLEKSKNVAQYRLDSEPQLKDEERNGISTALSGIKEMIQKVKTLNRESYTRDGLVEQNLAGE